MRFQRREKRIDVRSVEAIEVTAGTFRVSIWTTGLKRESLDGTAIMSVNCDKTLDYANEMGLRNIP